MKKFLCFLLAAFFSLSQASAQISFDDNEETQSAPTQNTPTEIWGQQNIFDQNSVEKRSPGGGKKVNSPIDGGLALLLGAGVLYGRKRFAKKS